MIMVCRQKRGCGRGGKGRKGRKGDSVRLRLQNIYGQNKWQLLAAAQVPHNGIDDVQEAYVVVAGSKGDTERDRARERERERDIVLVGGSVTGNRKCGR